MSEQEAFLRKVAIESYKNSERFVKDAEILLKKKSYAHAFALAILGEEELAKAAMYSNAADGTVGIEGKWRKDLSKSHTTKQIVAFGIALMYELILITADAADFAKKKAKGNVEKARQIYEKKYQEFLQEEQNMFAQRRGDVYEHLEIFERLQQKREKAMYVDASLEEKRISSPKSLKKSTAKRYISHVKERLDVLRGSISRKASASEKKMAILARNAVLNQFKAEERQKWLDWYGITEKDLIA